MAIQGAVGGTAAARQGIAARAWTGQMIAPFADPGQGGRTGFVSRDFDVSDPAGANLHITAQGLYRAFINGIRVGQDLLTPGWTCYDDRIDYQS